MNDRHPNASTGTSRMNQLDRRALVQRAAAVGVSIPAASVLSGKGAAQDASPGASPLTGATRSITRGEHLAKLRQIFPYQEPAEEGGHVILVSTTDIATLNPVTRSDVLALYAINNIFSYLAVQSPLDGTMAPDLADWWEVAADSVTYTFHLNPDATWHDGESVTAADVVLTFDAVMAENSASPLGSEFTGTVASYRAVDDRTFEVISQRPLALFLEKTVAAVPVMPKHIWGDIPFAEWGAAPGSTGTDPSQVVGSGPFRFVEWELGSHVTIERNDDYWLPDRVPHIDSFTIRVIADIDSAVQSVMVGESDTMRGMSPAQIERVQDANPDIDILTYDNMGWTAFLMNADPELGMFFSETDVRRAMLYAVDREMIVQTMLDGIGTPAVGVQPPGSPAYAPDEVTTVYTYDPGLANSLLDQAGWIDADGDGVREKDGLPFRLEFLYDDAVAVNEQLVPYLMQVFGDIGVEVVPRSLPQQTMVEQVLAGDYQLATVSIFWSLDDLGVLYRCDAIPPAGFNLARHCNEEYDRLNTASAAEMDAEKRRLMIIDQGNISNDDAHYGLLYFTQGVVPVNNRVRNLFFSAFGEMWSLSDTWIDEA